MAGEGNYYAVIPAEIMNDKTLTESAVLLYARIASLCEVDGYCWATNDYFAQKMNKSKDRISRLISQLEKQGHLHIEIVKNPQTKEIVQRRLWISDKAYQKTRKNEEIPSTPIGIFADTPIGKNNNTYRQKQQGLYKENNINIYNPLYPPEGETQKTEQKTIWEQYGIDIAAYNFPPELRAELEKWVQYKQERRQGYKPTGLTTILNRVKKYAAEYGAPAVIDLIEDTMASNYQGPAWDRLGRGKAPMKPQTQTKQTRIEEKRLW